MMGYKAVAVSSSLTFSAWKETFRTVSPFYQTVTQPSNAWSMNLLADEQQGLKLGNRQLLTRERADFS